MPLARQQRAASRRHVSIGKASSAASPATNGTGRGTLAGGKRSRRFRTPRRRLRNARLPIAAGLRCCEYAARGGGDDTRRDERAVADAADDDAFRVQLRQRIVDRVARDRQSAASWRADGSRRPAASVPSRIAARQAS